jgi:hypothetical protein
MNRRNIFTADKHDNPRRSPSAAATTENKTKTKEKPDEIDRDQSLDWQ